jgi:hypothetical protein
MSDGKAPTVCSHHPGDPLPYPTRFPILVVVCRSNQRVVPKVGANALPDMRGDRARALGGRL